MFLETAVKLLFIGCIFIRQFEPVTSDKTHTKLASLNKMVRTLAGLTKADVDNFEDAPPSNQTEVLCAVIISNVTSIEEKAQMFSLELYLDTYWEDYRLNHTNITEQFSVPDKYYKRLWIPDVGFSNAQGGIVHKVTEQNRNIMVGPNGQVYMTVRVSVELSCPMNFTYYPMDSQLCEVQLQSWRYNEKELTLKWHKTGWTMVEGASTKIPQYNLHIGSTEEYKMEGLLVGDSTKQCVETYAARGRGSFSCLELNFVFRRNLQFYALDIYIPSALIVMVSFIALFIDFKILPARIIIGSLSVTATTNIARSFKQNTPPVAYTKAADVWIWACQMFVFAVFLQLGLVNVVNRKFSDIKKADTFLRRSAPGKTVDKISRIFFPIAYLAFVVLYWACYIPLSQYNRGDNDTIRQLLVNSRIGRGEPIPG